MGDSNSKNAKIKVQMILKPRRSCPGALAHRNGWCRKFSHPQNLHDAYFLRTQVQSLSNVHPWPWFSQSRVGKGGGPYVATSLCSFSKYIYEPFSALKVFRIETTLSKSVIPRTISWQYLHALDSYFHFIIFLVLFDIWWASPWLCILSSLLIGISHLSLTVKQHIS